MPIYVKPSGVELDVDEKSVSAAESLGWKLKEEKSKAKSKPKAKADKE